MCGMKVDPSSAWRAEVVVDGSPRSVDTPRCAFAARHAAGAAGARLRLQDYYDRAWHDEADLVFVTGSDVLGPMGPDLVPVTPAAAAEFARDHGKREVLRAEQVTPGVLSAL